MRGTIQIALSVMPGLVRLVPGIHDFSCERLKTSKTWMAGQQARP
jgi:hypothetical protein